MPYTIAIAGKGGTGKTSLVAAFASVAQKKILCDADVDAGDVDADGGDTYDHFEHGAEGDATATVARPITLDRVALDFPELTIVGSSPEPMVQLQGRRVISRPSTPRWRLRCWRSCWVPGV